MVKWPEYYIDFNYLLFMPFFSNCLLDCTWLGVATLCNHFVPPVDVSIGEGPDFFRQLLVPAASFPLPFHIWPVEGSIVECQLCSSNHHLHFPVLIERRIFLSTFRLCLEMNNYIMDRKIMQFLCNSWSLCYIMRYMTKNSSNTYFRTILYFTKIYKYNENATLNYIFLPSDTMCVFIMTKFFAVFCYLLYLIIWSIFQCLSNSISIKTFSFSCSLKDQYSCPNKCNFEFQLRGTK